MTHPSRSGRKAACKRIFDYTQFAEQLREEIRGHAERLAAESGLAIEFIQRKTFRKKDRVQEILRARGDHPGLVSNLQSFPKQ